MAAKIMNGKEVAEEIRGKLKRDVADLQAKGVTPGLTVILVGEDPASQVYVRNKARACEKLGIASTVIRLPETATQAEILAKIDELNRDQNVHGILVQLPLPRHISEEAVIESIAPEKDVDGFHPISAGSLLIGSERGYLPCTPAGIIELIKRTGMDLNGKHAVVVGRSNIVGKPVALLLLRENATVTICHSRTKQLEEITRQADVLVVAVGKPGLIKRSGVKPGAVVIDVGSPAGDVDFADVAQVAGYITPVPGGVGPMTITMLLKNTVEAAQKIAGR
ncbi:MAG TPA: bifunctional methylenetetrahydrofolate dehydrogenase/methenyltetrahydrofolate cyclohydrolase FolD [Bacilli bacterium]